MQHRKTHEASAVCWKNDLHMISEKEAAPQDGFFFRKCSSIFQHYHR